jgi:hypothetical protein
MVGDVTGSVGANTVVRLRNAPLPPLSNGVLTSTAGVLSWSTVSGGGSGETNTASNVGTGQGVFKAKSGVDLQFKSLVAGSNIILTPNANDITITSTGGGGSGSSYDLILDTAGVAANNVYTSLATVLAAVSANAGISRVQMKQDVTVTSGSYDLSKAEFIAANPVKLTFGPGSTVTGPPPTHLHHVQLINDKATPLWLLTADSIIRLTGASSFLVSDVAPVLDLGGFSLNLTVEHTSELLGSGGVGAIHNSVGLGSLYLNWLSEKALLPTSVTTSSPDGCYLKLAKMLLTTGLDPSASFPNHFVDVERTSPIESRIQVVEDGMLELIVASSYAVYSDVAILSTNGSNYNLFGMYGAANDSYSTTCRRLIMTGANTLTLKHNDTRADDPNFRFMCPGNVDFVLAPEESCVAYFDQNALGVGLGRWRIFGGGTGGSTVATPSSFANMAALSAFSGTLNGQIATVLGFYTVNDGGGGDFYWAAGSAVQVVPGMIVSATGGQWIRRTDKTFLSAKWFGARGDRTSRLLSTLYGSFAAALAVYPHLTKRVRGTVRFTASPGGYIEEGAACDTVSESPSFLPVKRFHTTAYAAESGGFIDAVVEGDGYDSSFVRAAGGHMTVLGNYSALTSTTGTLQVGGTVLESDAAALARYELDEVTIQTAINFMQTSSPTLDNVGSTREVFIPSGGYLVRNMLKLGTASFGADTNALKLRGAGQGAFAYATTLYWSNPTEIGAILNVRGFENEIENIAFHTEVGCTSFAGILLKNGTPQDREYRTYGAMTSRITIRGCGFGNLADNLATTKSQRGIAFDSLFPSDGNIEEVTVERCSFNACMLGVDLAGGQPFAFVVRDCIFYSRDNAAGPEFGISFYSNIYGGATPFDLQLYGNEFQRQWVFKNNNARSVRMFGNSTENCKRFWTSGPFGNELTGACIEIRGCRMSQTSVDAAFDVWEPASKQNPKSMVLTTSYPTLTLPTDKPPYWMHFAKGECVNISGCTLEGDKFEIDGDSRHQGIIAYHNSVTIVSTGNRYTSKRPFVLDDYWSWGQAPNQDSFGLGGVTSLGDTITMNLTSRTKENLAPMHNMHNPSGTITISGTNTSAQVSWYAAGGGWGATLPPAQNTNDHDRGAIFDPTAIGQPAGPNIVQVGFSEFTDNYGIDLSVISTTGTPPAGAYQCYATDRAPVGWDGGMGFIVRLGAAPGAGNSVTVAYKTWK